MKNIFYVLIISVLLIAIYGSASLVMNEWKVGDICPKILSIPACYTVLFCFSIALVGHLLPSLNGNWIFFLFVGIVTLIASTGTIGELTNTTKCPRTAGGTPMCFISLAICLSLLSTKLAWLKLSR